MMSPGLTEDPNHNISTVKLKERVEIFMEGEKIAETKNAIKLFEPGYPDIFYIPKKDISGLLFIKFGDYECPHKGHAELYHVKHGSSHFKDAAWSYTKTYDEVKEIRNLIAFYPNKVKLIRITG